MILLSILIPFYNNSKYLERCIKSLKTVNNDKIEIIFVDDGSLLKESIFLEKQVKKLPSKNIRILKNEKNRGAGYTKNKALLASKGKYVIFLDSDDSVDKNYYIKLLNIIEKHNADIVCTNIALKYDNYLVKSKITDENLSETFIKKIDKNLFNINPEIVLGNKFAASACNKIIKKKIFDNYKFNENRCDDLTAVIPIICQAKKILYVDNLNYYYYQSIHSLTRTPSLEMYTDSIDSLIKTSDILRKEKISPEKVQLFYANNFIPFLYYNVINNKEDVRKKIFNYMNEVIDNNNFNEHLVIENLYVNKNIFMTEYIKKILSYIIKKEYKKANKIILINKIKYRFFKK